MLVTLWSIYYQQYFFITLLLPHLSPLTPWKYIVLNSCLSLLFWKHKMIKLICILIFYLGKSFSVFLVSQITLLLCYSYIPSHLPASIWAKHVSSYFFWIFLLHLRFSWFSNWVGFCLPPTFQWLPLPGLIFGPRLHPLTCFSVAFQVLPYWLSNPCFYY